MLELLSVKSLESLPKIGGRWNSVPASRLRLVRDLDLLDVWTYSYNFRDHMTGAVEKTSGGTVLGQVTYTYDALDDRIGMDENGTQTCMLYHGSTPIMDFNEAFRTCTSR
jgi:hypothetical protein